MANLKTDFIFTDGNDIAINGEEDLDGIWNNSLVNTLKGDDTINGISRWPTG